MSIRLAWSPARQEVRWSPDIMFESYWVSKIIGYYVKDGNYERSEKRFHELIGRFKEQVRGVTFNLWLAEVLNDLRPAIRLGHRRFGLIFIHIPHILNPQQGCKLALRWIATTVANNPARRIEQRLFSSIVALDGTRYRITMAPRQAFLSNVQDSHRYKHYRWF